MPLAGHDRRDPLGVGLIERFLFGGFERCLYPLQKFDSDAERRMAVILDRDALKWFRPASGQFHIEYRVGIEHHDYVPDFVAEAADAIHMIEVKARNELQDPVVLAKRAAAEAWCRHASEHAERHGGLPWRYALIPHDAIAENMTLAGLTTAPVA